MAELPDYYEVLQVHPKAEPEVIEAAYRRLARLYHPDVNRRPDAGERMRQINLAYEVLSDPEKRRAYDAARAANGQVGRHPATPARPAPSPGVPTIEVQPTMLSFGQVAPEEPVRATLRVLVRGNGSRQGRAQAGPAWLHVEPAEFGGPAAELRVLAHTAGLRAHTAYQGYVVVEAGSARCVVPVSLVVGQRPPVLHVHPVLLAMGPVAAGAEATATVALENRGGGQLHGEVYAAAPWLSVQPAIFTSNAVTLVLRASAAGLAPGRSYEGRIHICTNGGDAWITVDLLVDTPPASARGAASEPGEAPRPAGLALLQRLWTRTAPHQRALVLAALGLALLVAALAPVPLRAPLSGLGTDRPATGQPLIRATLAPPSGSTPTPALSLPSGAAPVVELSSVRGARWRIELRAVEIETRLGRWDALGAFVIVTVRYVHLGGPDDALPPLRLLDSVDRSYTPSQSVTHDYVAVYRLDPPAGLLSAGQRVDTALVFDVDPRAAPYRLEAPDGLRYRTLPLPLERAGLCSPLRLCDDKHV
jgi:hypothetical protein